MRKLSEAILALLLGVIFLFCIGYISHLSDIEDAKTAIEIIKREQ